MTDNQKRRAVVGKFVDFERREHEHLARVADSILPDPSRDPVGHAMDWAERMYAALKRFGDEPTTVPLFWHFAFNSTDPNMSRFHRNVHTAFRELTETQFITLTEEPSLQIVLGSAALYGRAAYDSSHDLELVWYAAVEAGNGVPPILLNNGPSPTAEA